MKYRNILTNEIIEPKTYEEKFVCENNSNFEMIKEVRKDEKKSKELKNENKGQED